MNDAWLALATDLARLGYLGASLAPGGLPAATALNVVLEALALYKRIHGLKPEATRADVLAHMKLPRCGRPDIENGQRALSRWKPGQTIRVCLAGFEVAYLNQSEMIHAYVDACQTWANVAAINFSIYVEKTSANITPSFGRIDGPYNTLAWSELPVADADVATTSLKQVFDVAERWTIESLRRVVEHELGHALGLGHLTAGNRMAAVDDPTLATLQAGDVQAIVALYGAATPTAPAPQPPADVLSCDGLVIGGRRYRVNLVPA